MWFSYITLPMFRKAFQVNWHLLISCGQVRSTLEKFQSLVVSWAFIPHGILGICRCPLTFKVGPDVVSPGSLLQLLLHPMFLIGLLLVSILLIENYRKVIPATLRKKRFIGLLN